MAVDYLDLLQADHGAKRMVAVPSEGDTVPVVYAAGLTETGKAGSTGLREAKMAKGKGKKGKKKASGKKLSKAARREIALKNLAKARRAKAHKAKGKSKPKASKKKGSHKQTPKQKKASLANLKKARLAKKKASKAVRAPKMPKRAPVRAAARKPRKLTKAERAAISRRNLKKARAALRKGAHKAARKPAKGKGGRKRTGKTTKAERRAIAMRNLKKAHAARRKAKRAGKKHGVGSYSYSVTSKTVKVPGHKSWEGKGKRKQTAKQRAASLRNLRKARAARKHGHGGHKAKEASKGKHRRTPAQKAASLANLKKARAARKAATRRHDVAPYAYHRQGGKRHVPAHLSYEYAMDNPLSGKELAWGAGAGLGWFLVTDAVDRFWATHKLTAKGSSDASGHALYSDVPLTAATFWTGYPGQYNPTAICAPMNLVRWISGAVFVAAPLLSARYLVSDPFWRTELQFAGYGAFFRIGGKAFMDLIAKVAMWTEAGQRLYNGEMRAMVMTSSDQSPLTSLPAAGLGAASGCGSCPSCVLGVGECSTGPGVGYPSMPRESGQASTPTSSTPSTSGQATNVPPPPLPPATTPTISTTTTTVPALAGVGVSPRRSLYDWGAREEDGEKDAA